MKAAVALAAVIVIAACGGTSEVATVSRASVSPTASPAASLSPVAPPQVAYTVRLVFSGGLATTVTQTKVNANSGCAAGRIDVDIVISGQRR